LARFFRLSIRVLVAKIQSNKVVRWCPDGEFLRPAIPASSTFQTCMLNSHQGHTMCVSMVDIQSATAEIRRGKKKRRKKKKEKNHRAKI